MDNIRADVKTGCLHQKTKAICALELMSASDSKRRCLEDAENEDLQCSICFDLVVDAVQIVCCGSLYCRACICKCASCPLCRKVVHVVADVRCERLSAAALRRCAWCSFKGNRAAIATHETSLCDFVPIGILRKRIEETDEALRVQTSNVVRIEAEKTALQRALTDCALGSEPAESCLRVVHQIDDSKKIFAVNRTEAVGHAHWICSWFMTQKQKMKPKEFVDLDMCRLLLEDAKGRHAVDCNLRCFTCGAFGHWVQECPLSLGCFGTPINEQLFNAGCCSNCGLPVKSVGEVEPEIQGFQNMAYQIHAEKCGKHCTLRRQFLEGLLVQAETAGHQPHMFLASVLKQGISELIRTYAGCIQKSAVLSIQIHESNHNVSVWLKKTPFMSPFPSQHEIVTLHLLHPVDPSRNKKLSLNTSGLQEDHQMGAENFMTSKQLDEYCHRGKYYISC